MDPYGYNYQQPEVYNFEVEHKTSPNCLFMPIPNPWCMFLKLGLVVGIIAAVFYILIYYYCPMSDKSALGQVFCAGVDFIKGLVWIWDEIVSVIDTIRNFV